MPKEERQVSNYLVRKLLGEAGFIQQGQEIQYEDKTVTNWGRHNLSLTLTEYKDARQPELTDVANGIRIDPFRLGVRNTNVTPTNPTG